MPLNDKKSTLMRQWEMMKILTVSRSDSTQGGRWDSSSEITEKLNEAGFTVSARTVQRDLMELKEIFPIELNDKSPRNYGWRWEKGKNLNIPGMGIPEALAMRLVEMHLRQMLPASMLEGLHGLFGIAEEKLSNLKLNARNNSTDWLSKVHSVPPTQPLLPPRIDQEVQADIYQALLEGRQISAIYQPRSSDKPKKYVLHPLGLIMRGSVSYLVATASDYKEPQLYALHRFKKALILTYTSNVPEGFNLDHELAKGLGEFSYQGKSIKLVISCSEWLAGILAETPLSADQKSKVGEDGWTRVTATVNDTWQLRWWLLGLGVGVEVMSPAKLRGEIAESLKDALSYYA